MAPHSVETSFVQAGRLRMRLLTCGDPKRPLVVCMHGFPDLAESWREVLPALADAGFYAVAPDMPGYGGTDIPADGRYDLDALSGDILALMDALGAKRAHIVGHDWGGAVAYHLAAFHPDRVDRLVVVNCPHPSVMARRIWWPAQLRRSWYMFFFQLPALPERLISRDGGSLVARSLRSMAVDKTNFTRERLAPYALNFSSTDRARAGVAYYRAIVRSLGRHDSRRQLIGYPKIRAPFRLVWATEDRALGLELTKGLEPWFEGPPEVRYLPGVGHFAPLEAPQKVAPLVVEHLKG